MTAGRRWALLGLVIAAAVVAFVIVNPGGEDKKTKTATTNAAATATAATTPTVTKPVPPPIPRIVVKNGKPVGGIKTFRVREGARVRFVVDSDVADHVHVHGYDVFKDVPAGGSARFNFPATITGGFEVELEDRAEQIAELKVQP